MPVDQVCINLILNWISVMDQCILKFAAHFRRNLIGDVHQLPEAVVIIPAPLVVDQCGGEMSGTPRQHLLTRGEFCRIHVQYRLIGGSELAKEIYVQGKIGRAHV